jgi:hypothetical protein
MGRRPRRAEQATVSTASTPNYSAWGIGTGYDFYASTLPELAGVNLVKDMFVMADTDETVGAMLYCITATMRQISWVWTPQVDGVDAPDDPEAKRYAALADGMLKDMAHPFSDHVDDVMTMLWAGFSPCEMVLKQRDGLNSRFSDGLYGIDSLTLVDQTTIYDWVYEGIEPVAMRQYGFLSGKGGDIPLWKVLHYRTNAQYNNPRGRPLLKNAWRVWRLKRKIQEAEATGIERELCGLPIFEMPQSVIDLQFDTDANGELTKEALKARAMVTAAQSAVKDVRLQRGGGLVIPSDTWADENQGDTSRKFQFRIQTSGGQRAIDSRTAARDYDHAIARVAMMQFLTLGQRSGGSYGLSEDQSSMAVNSIMALCDKLTSEFNRKAVGLLWRVNALPDKYRPRLGHSDVNKNSLTMLGQFLAGVGRAADLWAGDPKMRTALAKAAGLDYDHDAQAHAAETASKAAELDATPPPAPVMPAPVRTKTPAAANKSAAEGDE